VAELFAMLTTSWRAPGVDRAVGRDSPQDFNGHNGEAVKQQDKKQRSRANHNFNGDRARGSSLCSATRDSHHALSLARHANWCKSKILTFICTPKPGAPERSW